MTNQLTRLFSMKWLVTSVILFCTFNLSAQCINISTLSDFSGEWTLISDGDPIDLTIDPMPEGQGFTKIGSFATRGNPNFTGDVYGRCFFDELQFELNVLQRPPSTLSQYRYDLQLIGDKQMSGTYRASPQLPIVGVYAYRKQSWQSPDSVPIPMTQDAVEGDWSFWGGRELELPEQFSLVDPGGDLGRFERPLHIKVDGANVTTGVGNGSFLSIDGTGRELRLQVKNGNGDYLLLYRHKKRPELMSGFLYDAEFNEVGFIEGKKPVYLYKQATSQSTISNNSKVANVLNAMNTSTNTCAKSLTQLQLFNKNIPQIDGARLCNGAETSNQPVQCFTEIMSGTVSWGSGNRWNPQNAVDLCEGSKSANKTIKCFKSNLQSTKSWSASIKNCS